MRKDLALITGASSGLGKALAYLLAAKGYNLLLTGRSLEALSSVKKDLPKSASIEILSLDLQKPLPLLALIEEKAPDLVINAAGFGLYGDILSHPLQEQMDLLFVNGNAPIAITIASAKAMQKAHKPGVILNVSSAASGFIYPGFATYAASKSLLKEFSLSFDAEVKSQGIRVLVALPGRFYSAFLQRASKGIGSDSPLWTISLEKVAKKILKQVETKKRLQIIDFRYQLLAFFAKILPKDFFLRVLRKR